MHLTTKVLIFENIFLFIVPPILWALNFDPLLSYEWHKLLHIIGATLFLGNIIVTGVWMYLAVKTNNKEVTKFAAISTSWMDVLFTGPGVILVLFNGLWMSGNWGAAPFGFLNETWLLAALVSFLLSGLVWFYLIYLQEKMVQITIKNMGLNELGYLMKRWIIWGSIAIILPLLSMVLMVLKPSM